MGESTAADPLSPVPWPNAAASGSTCYRTPETGEVGSIWKKVRAKVRTSRQARTTFYIVVVGAGAGVGAATSK
jgi:hypothetical protein